MKGSSATSARAKTAAATGRSSAKHQPTRTNADSFALSGPSHAPEPHFHAYRKDLADVALAGRVIASHYAEPVERVISRSSMLHERPAEEADAIRLLGEGEPFWMLDDSVGWAWGYAGADRRVGFVRSEAVGRRN